MDNLKINNSQNTYNQKTQLPIEKDEKLLIEYGRAVAWINFVENNLYDLIHLKGQLYEANQLVVRNLLKQIKQKTLGQKIKIAKQEKIIKNVKLLNALIELNKNRVLLAHGISGEKVNMRDIKQSLGYVIEVNSKERMLDVNLLKEITKQARDLNSQLHQELIKK